MAKSAGGIGFLVVMGLMAIGLSDRETSTAATTDADPDIADTVATCDGVVVVETPTGSAHLPGDTDPLDPDATPVCAMQVGSGDEDAVAALQHALVQCHGQAVTVDGDYGPQTAGAVRAVQQQAGLAIDGEYGPATMEAMQWPVGGTPEPTGCAPNGAPQGVDAPSPTLPATG